MIVLPILEFLTSCFLLWYSYLPFQNVHQLNRMLFGAAIVWALCSFVLKRRPLINTSVLFFFSILFAFFSRATYADGWLTDWFLCMFLASWAVTLWMSIGSHPIAPGIFLVVILISPIHVYILDAASSSMPGVWIWIPLVLRTVWVFVSSSQERKLALPWFVFPFLIFSFTAIPFALNAGRTIQFVLINSVCVLLFGIFSRKDDSIQKALAIAVLFLAISVVVYRVPREIYVLSQIGISVLKTRHSLVDHPNTAGPFLLILSVLLLHFSIRSVNSNYRILAALTIPFLVVFEFLTYSRNSWASYTLFLVMAGVYAYWRRLHQKVPKGVVLAVLLLAISITFSPIKSIVQKRVHDSGSREKRVYAWNLGWTAIKNAPLTGSGSWSYYAHSLYNPGITGLEELHLREDAGAIHNHSMVLDMGETGGIPLAIAFLVLHIAPFFMRPGWGILKAGLLGLLLNNILDTASLWMTVYPHFWILLALTAGEATRGIEVSARNVRSILAGLWIVAGFLPMAEDHFLQESFFLHINNRDDGALERLRRARFCAPLDPVPVEAEKEIYLSTENVAAAQYKLSQLIRLKKNYAPYYIDLVRTYLHEYDVASAAKALETARTLDPSNVLNEDVYLLSAVIKQRQGDHKLALRYANIAFSHPLSSAGIVEGLELLNSMGHKEFVDLTFAYIDAHSKGSDRATALDNFYNTLLILRKPELAEHLLEKILGERSKLLVEELDYFNLQLARLYVQDPFNSNKARDLHAAGLGGKYLLGAENAILNYRWVEARQLLQESLEFYLYEEIDPFFEQLYIKSRDPASLRSHYRIIIAMPHGIRETEYQERLAHSYLAKFEYEDAAREFGKLSRMDYLRADAHWLEARCYYLAQDYERALQANDRLETVIPRNTLLSHSYSAVIDSAGPMWFRLTRAADPNDLGAIVWRTGFYAHPPSRIAFREEKPIPKQDIEVGIIGNAWLEKSDGVRFILKDLGAGTSLLMDVKPASNESQRGWNRFEWKFPHPVTKLSLQTDGLDEEYYDWAMWAFHDQHE